MELEFSSPVNFVELGFSNVCDIDLRQLEHNIKLTKFAIDKGGEILSKEGKWEDPRLGRLLAVQGAEG